MNAAKRVAKERWYADLAKAEERAGVTALKKEHRAAERTWIDAQDRLFDMRAQTPEGIILKLTLEWSERTWREWRAKGVGPRFDYHPDAIPSILMDLERLSGRLA